MLYQSTETYVAWAAGLLCLGGLLAAFGGLRLLRRSRKARFFRVRRQMVLRGWQLLFASVGLLIASGVALGLGQSAVELVRPPTLTPTASPTPSLTPVPPTATTAPTVTPIPSDTLPPTETLPPTDTPLPTLSPTPALPLALVTPPDAVRVTPPTEAVAADIRFSRRDNCATKFNAEYFDQVPKTIYAHFYYNNWLPGVQWSGVWYRDGQVIFVETRLWDGSTGGCGFSSYDNEKNWWPEGAYEVQIFIGERWLVSKPFVVVKATPTPTITPTRTPRTPTATFTPTATRTPRPPTPTRTPRPTATTVLAQTP